MALVIWDTVVMLPSVNRLIWYEAKVMAMKDEARQMAAQILLSSSFRKKFARSSFKKKRNSSIVLAQYVRRKIAQHHYSTLKRRLEYDMIYRWRARAAINIQAKWRCSYLVTLFKEHLRSKAQDDRRRREEYKAIEKQKRQRCHSEKVYQHVHEVQHIMITVTMWLKTKNSAQGIDKLLLINTYIQESKDSFHFTLNESDLRMYMEGFFLSYGPLSWHEMLTKKSLMCLSKRLMVRSVNQRRIIIFRRRTITEHGELLRRQCQSVDGILVVMNIYLSARELVISSYNPLTSQPLRGSIRLAEIRRQLIQHKDEFLKMSQENLDRYILLLSRKPLIIDWLLLKLRISQGENQFLLFVFDNVEEKRRNESSAKVQRKWRQVMARVLARHKVELYFEKFYDREYRLFYYVDNRSRRSSWEKPRALGSQDLKSPIDEWRELKDENGSKCYFNPATGQSTYLSEDEAAIMLQRYYRKHASLQVTGRKVDFFLASKAIYFIDRTLSNYQRDPEKLPNLTNFALYLHCIKHDFYGAKKLYEDAISRSPSHPLIQRALGICLMLSKEEPWFSTTQRAHDLFKGAEQNDIDFVLFKPTIEHFFRWSVIANPESSLALLNYALLYQCIVGDYDLADKLYRRALAIDSQSIFVKTNFGFFDAQRYPGGLYEGKGPSTSAVMRSEVKESSPQWCEWSLLFDQESPRKDYSLFWYNKITKETLFEEPDWSSVWQTRIRRSDIVDTSNMPGLIEYFDPRLKENFVQNMYTGECMTIVSPLYK